MNEQNRPHITAARITQAATEQRSLFAPLQTVHVTVDGVELELFNYYLDEISFSPEEFLGLTVEQAIKLKFDRDRAYLEAQSRPGKDCAFITVG